MTNGPIESSTDPEFLNKKKKKKKKSLLKRANDWANSNSISDKMSVDGRKSHNQRVKDLNEREEKKHKGRRSSAKRYQNQK